MILPIGRAEYTSLLCETGYLKGTKYKILAFQFPLPKLVSISFLLIIMGSVFSKPDSTSS